MLLRSFYLPEGALWSKPTCCQAVQSFVFAHLVAGARIDDMFHVRDGHTALSNLEFTAQRVSGTYPATSSHSSMPHSSPHSNEETSKAAAAMWCTMLSCCCVDLTSTPLGSPGVPMLVPTQYPTYICCQNNLPVSLSCNQLHAPHRLVNVNRGMQGEQLETAWM